MSQDKTVLIVDDDAINREILKEAFEGSYSVIEASDGREAIDILREKPQEIGAVMLDLIMPVTDGFAVLEFMKTSHLDTDIPVVIITSDDSRDLQKRLSEYHICDLLNKPFLPMVILRRTRNFISLYAEKREEMSALRAEIEMLRAENTQLYDKVRKYEKILKDIHKKTL